MRAWRRNAMHTFIAAALRHAGDSMPRLSNGVSRTIPDPAGENHLWSVQAMSKAGRVCVMPLFAAAGANASILFGQCALRCQRFNATKSFAKIARKVIWYQRKD
jgi:hypothetical protein